MRRAALTEKVLDAKRRLGLTWATISRALGDGSPVFYTAALLGHQTLKLEEARKAGTLLELPEEDWYLFTAIPQNRGAQTPMPPTDPLLYRFYELVQGYGPTWKELINEEFGDGIMSAIDFNMTIEREADPKGDRVRIIMSGKFLPFKHF